MTTAHRAAEEPVPPPAADLRVQADRTPARSTDPTGPPAPASGTPRCETCRKPLVDRLTGVLDRHEWDRRAGEAVADARERCLPMALILMDLDSFKSVNDTYGHPAGDAVLRAVAGVLGDLDGGIAGRYGGHAGDEFLVLLPGATAEEAARVARSTQDAVRALTVSARASRSTTVRISGQTVSMGVAAEPAEAVQAGVPAGTQAGMQTDVLSELLLDSDVGLRAAKGSGGDTVCGVDAAADAVGVPALPAQRDGGSSRSGHGPRRQRNRDGGRGGGRGGEVRIPFASFGQDAGSGPEELVLTSAAAEHLHEVLTEMLGRRPWLPA